MPDASSRVLQPLPIPPDLPMRRYKLKIAYDGTKFHGWQKQEPPGEEPLRTVAGVIERNLMRLLRHPVNVLGASRTDAGVHAKGQVAHLDLVPRIPDERLAMAMNSRLPDDVDILQAEPVHATFDAIQDVVSKQYRYRIYNSPRKPLDRRFWVWRCWRKLDVARMNEAARRLVGTHDFNGFAAANHGRATTVRTIFDCHVEQPGEYPDEIHVVVAGDGFLYNMVRIIAGTLVEVGTGRFEPAVIDRVLESTNRQHAGTTLEPHGLCLEWIKYKDPPTDLSEGAP